MLAGSTLVGVAAVQATTADALGADDEEALLAFGALAAAAIDIARRYASSQLQRRQSDALAQVARAVSESLRLSDVMQLILSHATALLHAEGAFVLLRNGDVLDIMAADGRGERVVGMKMPMSTSLAGQSAPADDTTAGPSTGGTRRAG